MSFNIVLNSSNVANSTTKSVYTYNFLGGGFTVNKHMKLCVSEIILPYSWFNINTQVYNNASYQISLSTGTNILASPQTITMPNGSYSITDIENYLQLWCLQNNFYKTNTTTGLIYYYVVWALDLAFYAYQILCLPVETSAQAGWTYPASFPYPSVAYTPQITISSTNNFLRIVGFSAGSYPCSATTIVLSSVISNITPNFSPVNSLVVRCSLVNNNTGFPTDVLDVMPINATFGSNINYLPSFEKFVRLSEGKYTSFSITFQDQNLNTIYMNDSNITISLILQDDTPN